VTESLKTAAFAIAALTLALAAWALSPRGESGSTLSERGQPFFPELSDPNLATSLEVVTYDEQGSAAKPFKVQNRDGRWTIPSQYNYPADGGERLAGIASSLIAMKKEDVASELPADQEKCQVLDPLDETLPSTKGRGTRIIVNGVNDRTLADVIVGAVVEGRPAYRYARLPGSNRTYVAHVEGFDVSTKFEDWIETNLLKVDRSEIDQILVRNYSVSPARNSVDAMEVVPLRKRAEDVWTIESPDGSAATDTFTMNLMVTRLVELAIQGVRPKPPSMSATLLAAPGSARVTRADIDDLAAKGFFFGEGGQQLASSGEVLVHTSPGVFYALRFGNLVDETTTTRDPSALGRYLFISVGLDAKADKSATDRAELLRARFAPWYYVVSEDSVGKIRLRREDLKSRSKN
jgi:Domain of unknown function (DUF4340)